MASRPDTRQDADLQIRIPAHWLDTLHRSTDQKVGGSSPSERARSAALRPLGTGLLANGSANSGYLAARD